MAMASLDQFHVSKAFIGIDGASQNKASPPTFSKAQNSCAKWHNKPTRSSFSDSEKFSSPGFARIIPYKEADILITDSHLTSPKNRHSKKRMFALLKPHNRNDIMASEILMPRQGQSSRIVHHY